METSITIDQNGLPNHKELITISQDADMASILPMVQIFETATIAGIAKLETPTGIEGATQKGTKS